jgi:hypothetical protein
MTRLMSHFRDDILIVTIAGTFEMDDSNDTLKQYLDTVRSDTIKKILLDTRRLSGRKSIAGTYLLAQDMPKPGSKRMTAIVEKEENRRYAELYKLVFHNAGYKGLGIFYDYHKALEWLTKQ